MSSGATGYDTKIWELLNYFYDTQAWLPKNVIFMNKAAFDALDKPPQEALIKAAAAAEERGWNSWQEKTSGISISSPAKGMKVLPPSPEFAAG